MSEFKAEAYRGIPDAELSEEGTLEQGVEMLPADEPEMTPEQTKYAARVALYGSEELATEVTKFYGSLVYSFRTQLAYISNIEERNSLAKQKAEETAERMDLSRGRGYLQHPGHEAFRPKKY